MKIVNTAELKDHANQLLKLVHRGNPVAVTRHGKPYAALIPLDENGLEDLFFEFSPRTRRLVAEAEADVRAGRLVSLEKFLKEG